MLVTPEHVFDHMLLLCNLQNKKITNGKQLARHIRSTFGFDPETVVETWNRLQFHYRLPANARIKHLLFMCVFFKSYGTYDHYSQIYNVSYRTFFTWVWFFAELVANLSVVSRTGTKKFLFLHTNTN
jgi:hypothetical protein